MADPLFSVPLPGESRRMVLEGLTLLYHRPSGQTHVLAEPMPEILDALGEGAVSAAGLMDRLAAAADVTADPDALTARLAELEDIGLVVRS